MTARRKPGKITDKARLDWLAKTAWGVSMNFDTKRHGKWKCSVGGDEDGFGETPRQAIDAAMRVGEGGGNNGNG